jgi:hypothetical protein
MWQTLGTVAIPRRAEGVRSWIGWTLLFWLVINAQTFAVGFAANEVVVLPAALQAVDHSWLANDWCLNLNISYRRLFNYIAGTIVYQLDFLYGAYLGRLLVTLLLAVALTALFRALRLRLWLALLSLALFLGGQSLTAGEWIVDGFETKTIAYSFILLTLGRLPNPALLSCFRLCRRGAMFPCPCWALRSVLPGRCNCAQPGVVVGAAQTVEQCVASSGYWCFGIRGGPQAGVGSPQGAHAPDWRRCSAGLANIRSISQPTPSPAVNLARSSVDAKARFGIRFFSGGLLGCPI